MWSQFSIVSSSQHPPAIHAQDRCRQRRNLLPVALGLHDPIDLDSLELELPCWRPESESAGGAHDGGISSPHPRSSFAFPAHPPPPRMRSRRSWGRQVRPTHHARCEDIGAPEPPPPKYEKMGQMPAFGPRDPEHQGWLVGIVFGKESSA